VTNIVSSSERNDGFLQFNPDTRRCRFIAHTADLSALAAFPDISLVLVNFIIGPRRVSRYPDLNCKIALQQLRRIC